MHEIKKIDVVIVLANEMSARGVLNYESKQRANYAAEIFKKTNASYITTVGWNYRLDSDIKIANAFRKYLMQFHKINSKKILVELNSRDTVGDAIFTKLHIIIPRKKNKICIVTSDYHVERVKKIFNYIYGEKFKINVLGCNTKKNPYKIKNEKSSIEAFKNTFKNIKSGDDEKILDALLRNHPYYNGVVYKTFLMDLDN